MRSASAAVGTATNTGRIPANRWTAAAKIGRAASGTATTLARPDATETTASSSASRRGSALSAGSDIPTL